MNGDPYAIAVIILGGIIIAGKIIVLILELTEGDGP